MRILVLRGGALGDFVVTLPALGLLRARWPDARIELVGNVRAAALALNRHYLDAVHAQDDARWARLGAGVLDMDEPLARWLASFDLVLNFRPDGDGAISGDLERLGFNGPEEAARRGEGGRVLLSAGPSPTLAPASAHFCAALAPLGLAARSEDLAPRLFPTGDDRRVAAAWFEPGSKPMVALHPGSGSPRKNWPLERWLAVVRALAGRRDFRLGVVLGEAELESWAGTGIECLLPAGATVLWNLDTPVLAAVLARCALFLGHDSGPAHIASAAGCRSVLVFGPTDPLMWAPPHAHVRAVRGGLRIEDTQVSDVLAALSEW